MELTPDCIRLLGQLDDTIRQNLQEVRDSLFEWLLRSTFVVVFGILMEAPEVFHETCEAFRKASTGETGTRWIKVFSLVGWLFIVVGVTGEGVFEAVVSSADGHLQTFDHIRLIETQKESAEANVEAGDANERASMNEKEAALLRKLALGRQLTGKQISDIARSLRHFSGRNLFIASYSGDAEAARLGLQIMTALALAGIQVENNLGRTLAAPGGVEFGVHISGPSGESNFMTAVAGTIHTQGNLKTTSHIIVPTMRVENAVVGIMVGLRRVPGAE